MKSILGVRPFSQVRRRLGQVRQQFFPSYGLYRLDRRLLRFIGRRPGVYLEIGANDGIDQSNTYLLERHLGWTGILIEPIPEVYEECKRNRPNSRVYNVACTSPERAEQKFIEMAYCDQMSFVTNVLDESRGKEWISQGVSFQPGVVPRQVSVPCTTLSVLLEHDGVEAIDFMSLDVEGSELEVLQGLNLAHCRPKWLLVEVLLTPVEKIQSIISSFYTAEAEFDDRDILFRRIK